MFYFYFVIFVGVFYFISYWTTFSFGWLSFWWYQQNIKLSKEYVRPETFNRISSLTAQANMRIWQENQPQLYYLEESVNKTHTIKDLVNTEVIDLMEWEARKQDVLESYINQIRLTMHEAEDLKNELSWRKNEKRTYSTVCDSEKMSADQQFYQHLDQNEPHLMVENLKDSSEKAICYIENRVYANAYDNVFRQLTFYSNILKQKFQIVENNKDILLSNADIFRENKLEKLLQLRRQLSQFNVQ